jgi:hypothetical protein
MQRMRTGWVRRIRMAPLGFVALLLAGGAVVTLRAQGIRP